MAEGAHQFAAADGVGQVVLTNIQLMEQHQAAAVAQGVQFALIQAGSLVQAITVTLQQLHQTGARQAAQLFLCAQLDCQYGAGQWLPDRGSWRGFMLGLIA